MKHENEAVLVMKNILYKILYKLGYEKRYGKVMKKFLRVEKTAYNNQVILSESKANQLIIESIKAGKPCFIARLGSVELSVLYNYYLFANKKSVKWDFRILENLHRNAGFFPITNYQVEQFANLYKEELKEIDIMGVWFNEGEEEICKQFCKNVEYIPLAAIEPYYHENPWSEYLAGKKLLVIHPFEDSIKYQYHNHRDLLFSNKKILPEFDLITIKAVQTIANNNSEGFKNWFDALDWTYKQIDQLDFDIAIIGAGAYGLPLGAYIKRKGKMAIHMGGATQVLFGILGKRWESMPEISKHFNNNWKRPFPNEVPSGSKTIEDGCYW